MKNRIQKVSGVYECTNCGEKTRDTGYGEAEVTLCKKCYVSMEYANAINNGAMTIDAIPEKFRSVVESFLEN